MTQTKIEKDDSIRETKAPDFRDNWYGVVTINGGNMADYFKLKSNCNNMTDYLKNNVKSSNDTRLSSSMTDNRMIDSESENDQYIGFGFTPKTEDISVTNHEALKNSDKSNYAFDNPCLGLNSPTKIVCSTNSSSTKSTKKRKKEFESDNSHITEMVKQNAQKKLKTETINNNCKNGFINPALNLEIKPEEDCNGKEFEVFRAQFGLENCGLDLTDEKNDKKRVTFNDHVMLYEYNINSTKKKKGEGSTLDKFEVENKKNKKKRKHLNITTSMTDGIVNEALDVQILYEEINDNELNEHKNKKIKKRKISKTSNLETIQESPEKEIIEINIESEDTLDSSVVENGETDVEQKSKKKKKKKEEKKAEVENITNSTHVTNEKPDIEEIITSKKIKKYKKNKVEEEMAISKKYKKEKKKNKENCKSEKHTIQTEINKDQQDIKILNKSNSKQQQNDYLIENENMDAAVTETLSVTTTKEEEGSEEKESLEKIKRKKKKRKSIEEDCPNIINICRVEREISDKENTDKEQDPNIKKLAKKDKKSKKSKDKNVSDIGDSSNLTKEVLDVNVTKEDKIENAEFTNTPSKKGKVIDAIDNIINSPWSAKVRMSKKMLITLFHNNAILEFPGSNIHNIKGYGTDVESELYVE